MTINKFISWGLAFSFLVASPIFASPKVEKKAPITSSSFVISKELKAWNEKQTLPLQPHQLKPIAYLEKNKGIKGLIINHWLGTGKTLLAIGFAERNPDQSVIILAPGFLEGHWMKEIEKYGVKDKSRYRFVSHSAAEVLAQEDLSKTVVIIDESHRFIEKVRSSEVGATYAPLYLNLRKAQRILSLTGTPIYSDVFDLVYQVNLVSGKEAFPFNQEEFRCNYSKVNAFKSYWRGYLLENYYIGQYVLPSSAAIIAAQLGFMGVHSFIVPILSVMPSVLYVLTPVLMPIQNSPIRMFNPKKLAQTVQKYVSHYDFDQDARFYPKKSLTQKQLSYSNAQLSILYRFYDSHLTHEELKQLSKDQTDLKKEDISRDINRYLNNSLVQDLYKNRLGAGREIGNLLFINKSDAEKDNKNVNKDTNESTKSTSQYTIFPEKFKRILKEIECSKGPVVIYSSYYYNGLLLFKQFLDVAGYKGKYRIFHPEASTEMNMKTVEDYNSNKIKILLLHPDITEGISLKGTRQLHFLDMPTSSELANQISGRAIRYQSHTHLPKNEQHVAIYYWCYKLGQFGLKAHIAARENWYHNFSELNYYSQQGQGRIQVDKNALLKRESPDMLSYMHFNILSKQTEEFRNHIKTFCIENTYSGLEL